MAVTGFLISFLDPESPSSVSMEEAKTYAKDNNIQGPFETSAFTGKGNISFLCFEYFIYPRICFVGIEDLFGLVAKKLLDNEKKRQKEAEEESQKRAFKLNGNGGSQKSGCC